jgi:hypothetical protein
LLIIADRSCGLPCSRTCYTKQKYEHQETNDAVEKQIS